MAALKALVVLMGLLILGGLMLLGAIIVGRLAHRPSAPSQVRSFAAPAIALPAGARVEKMSLGADRLVLDIVLPDGNREILVLDLRTGRRIGTIPLHTAR